MTFSARVIAKTSILALVLSMTTASVVTVSATPAFAERGGNGNGNGGGDRGNGGNGDRGNDRAESQGNGNANGNRGGNGRGALARELGSLNAANANPRALENASPDSMPGKLYAYKQAQANFIEVAAVQNDAYDEYQRLEGLSEDEIAAEYPDGGYEDALNAAAETYNEAREEAVNAQTAAQESLAVLTDGRELSSGAMGELNNMLGL